MREKRQNLQHDVQYQSMERSKLTWEYECAQTGIYDCEIPIMMRVRAREDFKTTIITRRAYLATKNPAAEAFHPK